MVSAKDFTLALQQLPEPTDAQKNFLQAHFDAQSRASTATKLSEAAEYDGYRGINLQYGLLAARLAERLGLPKDVGFSLLVDFVRPAQVTNAEWVLIMKREFAEALLAVGWVHRT